MSETPASLTPSSVDFDLNCVKCRYNLRGCFTDGPCPECSTPVADSLAAVGQLGPTGPTVDFDRACIQCSYNLRGLPSSGRCPECGLEIEKSLRGFLLQFATPAYLGQVLSGLSLVLNGILLMIVVGVLGFFVGMTGVGAGVGGKAMPLLVAGLAIIPNVMILLGYWKYTEPDPGFVGTEVPNSARKTIRVAVAIQAGTSAVGFLVQIGVMASVGGGGTTLGGLLGFLLAAINLAGGVAWLVQFFANMRYTRWLAARVPDPKIVARTRTYMWLLPLIAIVGAIALFLGPLVALVMYWNLLDRLRKHLKTLVREPGSAAA